MQQVKFKNVNDFSQCTIEINIQSNHRLFCAVARVVLISV